MARTRGKLASATALLLLSWLTFELCIPAALAQIDDRRRLEALVDASALWPTVNVPVCWMPGADAFPQEKAWVKDAVETLIEDQSDVDFQDWDACTAADEQRHVIQITVADAGPESQVGRQFARDQNRNRLTDALGREIPRPTKMILNFTFKTAFKNVLREDCGGKREHCIRAIAVHEFLHGVGFLHEQLRRDANQECKDKWAHKKDFGGYIPLKVGDYDPDSHMNYCANMYREPIRLSNDDVLTLNAFYRKTG